MKKVIGLFLVVLSTSAFGQSIDKILGGGNADLGRIAGEVIASGQARREKDQLSKLAAKYNESQPAVRLHDIDVVLRMSQDSYLPSGGTEWLRSEISALFTANRVAAYTVWDTGGIDQESDERRDLRGNDEVDESTLPAKHTLRVGALIAEASFVRFDRYQQFNGWWGSWARSLGVNLSFGSSRETSYFGLSLTLRRRDTGQVLAVYKTMGVASSADNVGGNVAAGFFNGGGSSSGDSYQERQNRALENALREMGQVLAQKSR